MSFQKTSRIRVNCLIGETIVAAGDSAGGNLVLGATFKCIELGIPPPSGLFLAYTPTWLSFVPSPARLISFMDPMLPFGFMMRCMKGMYNCIEREK